MEIWQIVLLVLVAILILSPESLAAVRAARANHLQRSINIALGSVLASISLTIPLVLIIFRVSVDWSVLVIVPALAILTINGIWVCILLGMISARYRDVPPIVVSFVQVIFFVTPIFYLLDAVPEGFRRLVELNPLTPVVENFRQAILWGTLPEWKPFGVWFGVTGVVMLLGYAWFMKTKKGFADVI